MKNHGSGIKSLPILLCIIACTAFILQGNQTGHADDRKPVLNRKPVLKEMIATVHNITRDNLRRAAKQMDNSIEQRVNKIQIGADKNTFISFVLCDTFPKKFKNGEIVGFVDVSGYGDKLPDGQYGVKIYSDEKNLNKPSELINVKTREHYFFNTDTEEIRDRKDRNESEFSIKKGCTWISVLITTLHGNSFIRKVCLDCPACCN